MSAVIECEHVTKRYGDLVAVNDVSLCIEESEIFGLVGPNGAGKTTLIEMMESLRMQDSGSISVLGIDPTKDTDELHERIGVQLQTTSIQPNLKVREAIRLFASLYRKPLPNPEELLVTLSLQDKADTSFKKLSGGQKQRVAIALALVNDPAVLFFDEITTGLDPQARRKMWQLVKNIRNEGKTIFLTTHYMEEAEELCDRVGVIDHGKIIALDTPSNLMSSLSAESKVTMWTPAVLPNGEDTGYAFGWTVRPYRGLTTRSHGGQVAGFVAGFFRFPEQQVAFIMFMNRYRAPGNRLLDVVLDTFMPALEERR